MEKINRHFWKDVLTIAQPYWYPVGGGRRTFLGLLLLLLVFVFAAFFLAVGAFSLMGQHYFPQLSSTLAPGLAESVTKIANSPAIYLLRLALIAPLCGFFYCWKHLRYHWRAWSMLAVLLFLLLSASAMNVASSYVGRDLVTAIAQKEGSRYSHMLLLYGSVLAFTTPLVVFSHYARKKLALNWLRWLTHYFLDKYFHNRAYYQINSQPDLDNPDQRISQDIGAFTNTSINVTLTILTQIIDIFAYSWILWSISKPLVAAMIAYSVFGNWVTIGLSQRLVHLNFNQFRCEGDFRYGLVHIRNNAESIAFYGGEEPESSLVKQRFNEAILNSNQMIAWQRNLDFFSTGYNYFLLILPYLVVAPLYLDGQVELGVITQASIACNQVLGALSLIVSQFESLSAFAAAIHRLGTFSEALEAPKAKVPSPHMIESVSENRLALENMTLQTPNGERVLVKDLSVSVEAGKSLLIVGASGCGKSSLLRALAGLWDAGTGTVVRPKQEEMLFLPQRPYMILGSLREQLLYPNTSRNIKDEELHRLLRQVNLEDLPARVGGFDAEIKWDDVLSLGEQQRLAFARVLRLQPRYAILDEATSALDMNNELHLYRLLQQTETAFISVGHRSSLLKYHQQVLELLGDSRWRLVPAHQYSASAG